MSNIQTMIRAMARLKRGLSVAALAAALGLVAPAAMADGPNYLRVAANTSGINQTVSLDVNKSMIVDLPTNAGEVIASQPSVAAVLMRTKTRAIIQGVAGGETNVFFLDASGNNIAVLNLKVSQPRSDVGTALEAAIARNIPGSRVHVESVSLDGSTNRVVLSGSVQSQDDLNKAMAMAAQFAGGDRQRRQHHRGRRQPAGHAEGHRRRSQPHCCQGTRHQSGRHRRRPDHWPGQPSQRRLGSDLGHHRQRWRWTDYRLGQYRRDADQRCSRCARAP